MKRLTAILLTFALLFALSACAGGSAPEATPAPAATAAPEKTAAPTPTAEPAGSPATVLVDKLGAVFKTLNAGDKLELTGEDGDYYSFELDGVSLLIEKRFVRLASDKAFEQWQGYTGGDTPVYADVYLAGDALQTLPLNTPVTVLADLGRCLRLRLEDGTEVFASAEQVKTSPTEYYYYGGGDTGSGGGGGGGGADGGSVDIGTIARRAEAGEGSGVALLAAAQPGFPTDGAVLADGVECYLRLLSRGDSVSVTGKSGDVATLLIDGQLATVPSLLLRMEGEKAYAAWDGYCKDGAAIFGDWTMTGAAQAPTLNTPVKVLEELGKLCYVQWEQGHGFMLREGIADAPVAWSYYDAGNSGGSGGGGSEWTAPVK